MEANQNTTIQKKRIESSFKVEKLQKSLNGIKDTSNLSYFSTFIRSCFWGSFQFHAILYRNTIRMVSKINYY